MNVLGSFILARQPDPPFIMLARRLFSVSANSVSCERLFSVFGNTLTKLRNRLGTNTMCALAELKMFIKDEHRRSESLKKRVKRHFGDRKKSPPQPQASETSTPAREAPVEGGDQNGAWYNFIYS